MCTLACVVTKWEFPLECHWVIPVYPCESHLVRWHEPCPIFPSGTCPEVILLGVIPIVIWPGDSGNQTCNGAPRSPSNTPANQILIEFQRTCKNLVQFCYSIFLADVSVIPVKWSPVVTSSVGNTYVNWLIWTGESRTMCLSWGVRVWCVELGLKRVGL